MFGVSFFELIVILLVVLIFLGPDKLPEAASKMGRVMGFLKKNSDALRREFYNAVYAPADEVAQKVNMAARDLIGLESMDPASMNCEQKARLEEKQKAEAEQKAVEASDSTNETNKTTPTDAA